MTNILPDRLICPKCQYRLINFNCTKCNTRYPLKNGIPIIINEDKSIFRINTFLRGESTFFRNKRNGIKLPSMSLNFISKRNYQFIANELENTKIERNVLIIGGSVDGTGISVLKEKKFNFIEADVSLGKNTKIVFDAHNIPYQDNTFDLVVIQAVLEHVVSPEIVVNEIYRTLKDGGLVYSEIPFMQQVHGGKYDFQRYTFLGQEILFRNFEKIDANILCGPAMAFTWSIQYFFSSFFSTGYFIKLARLLSRIFFFFKYFDYYLIKKESAFNSASAFYFIGRKNTLVPQREIAEILNDYKGF